MNDTGRTKAKASSADHGEDRLYQQLARKLFDQIATGRFAIGDRLPAERELALEHNVSRPTVREAIIALEVQGLVEVKIGSGAYVRNVPGRSDEIGFSVTAFELIEARAAIEGEVAALAAVHITDAELDALDALVARIAVEVEPEEWLEDADRDFHFLIARATRNAALANTVEQFWALRASEPDTALMLAKARAAKVKPVVEEHRAIAEALRSRDPAQARNAMRAHMAAVLDHLLFATEEAAVEQARSAALSTRRRFAATHLG
jgi:DNA-binding FadR family transcriptional regulator